MNYKNKQKGFTLIELLVVIAIIGLLSTLAVVSLNNARQKARDARRVSDVKQIQTALELFYNDALGYPDETTAGQEMTANTDLLYGTVTYMTAIPADPDADDCATDAYTGYSYNAGDSETSYSLEYCLAGQTGGIPLDMNTAGPGGVKEQFLHAE